MLKPSAPSRHATKAIASSEPSSSAIEPQLAHEARLQRLTSQISGSVPDPCAKRCVGVQNGPEVNPAGGQSTGNFENPGLTGGLRGRKRDATEGGTREIGQISSPFFSFFPPIFPDFPPVFLQV